MKNFLSFLYAVLILFLIASPVQSQVTHIVEPEISRISLERLERYDAFLNQEIKDGRIPGAVSLVIHKGQIVHRKAFGYSDVENKATMRQDQIFFIQSMTKPIISVAFMMLYEEGRFLLTDPVSKYLPEFKNLRVALDPEAGEATATVPAKSEVTMVQLLNHTAGFSHGLGSSLLDRDILNALYYKTQESVATRVNTLIRMPMTGHPGEQWYYSASPDVLALLIEHITGKTVAEFLQERLFNPLGMNDTGYNLSTYQQSRMIKVHSVNDNGKLTLNTNQPPMENNTVFGGTHGLFSTASDYMKFCQMLLNRGEWNGYQFLSPKTIELMTADHTDGLYPAPGQGFGLGFGVITDVVKTKAIGSIGQYYWSGAFCTYFFIDPEEELIAILMTQLAEYTNYYGSKMRQFVYQAFVN